MSLKPICVPCERFMRMKKQDYYFIEGMPRAGVKKAEPGLRKPEDWVPYKIWIGDLYACPDCGAQVISGRGHAPLAEHYQPNFAETVELVNAHQLIVKDC